jgi:hypothetical protein
VVEGAEDAVVSVGQGFGSRVRGERFRVKDSELRVEDLAPVLEGADDVVVALELHLTECINQMALESHPPPEIVNLLLTITCQKNITGG